MCTESISEFFLKKMSFCWTETPFYDRPPVLV